MAYHAVMHAPVLPVLPVLPSGRAPRLALAALALAGSAAPALADQPLWEAGLGLAAVSFNHYRGSSLRSNYLLPAPYFVYRGEFLQADRGGLKGVFLDSPRLKLDLSLSASVPVRSKNDSVRSGMPNLKPTVEFGPSLQVKLWRSADDRQRLDLRLPVRAAFTVEGSPRYVGMVASPHLNLDLRDPLGAQGWNLGLLAGPIFGDRKQHAYFYDVAPQYASAGRPAYRAGGGYSGSQFIAALSKRYPRFWVGGFVRYDALGGAKFADSPLVERKNAWAAGLAVSWILGESSQRVPDSAGR